MPVIRVNPWQRMVCSAFSGNLSFFVADKLSVDTTIIVLVISVAICFLNNLVADDFQG